MRLSALSLLLTMSVVMAACGHREQPAASEAPAPAAQPPTASNGGLVAQVVAIERRSDHLSIRLRLENLDIAPIEIRNVGDTLTGFRAQIEGRSYNAESHRRDGQPIAAAALAQLPGQTPVELDLRWELRPSPGIASYDSTIIIGNLFQGDKKLPELSILVPGFDSRERRKTEKKSGEKVSL